MTARELLYRELISLAQVPAKTDYMKKPLVFVPALLKDVQSGTHTLLDSKRDIRQAIESDA